MLDELESQIITVPLVESDEMDIIASSEVNVHRRIYIETSALSILHGHSRYAIVESMVHENSDLLIPKDMESIYLLHEIPIVEGRSGSEELASNVARALRDHKGVIVRGHGSFARGATVDESYVVLCSIEHACFLKYMVDK